MAWVLTGRTTGCSLGLVAAVVAALSAVPVKPAHAHGRFPRLGQVVSHPTLSETVAVRGTFGLIISSDGGSRWQWICLPVMGVALSEDPTMAILSGGSIVAATFDGLARSDPTGCNWSYPSLALTDVYVIDQATDPMDSTRAWAVTSDGVGENSVFETRDGGASWTPTSPPIDAILFETIEVAPADASRIYLSGAFPPTMVTPRRVFAFRSSDGGATWQRFPFPLAEDDRNLYLLGVDPNNPDRILARVRGETIDRLVESVDAGESWSPVLELSDIAAFAWSTDGGTVYVGGIEGGGLHRSTDRGRTFTQVGMWETSCVGFRQGETWLCGNDPVDGFALGRLDPSGEVQPLLRLSEITDLLSCGPDDNTTMVCEPELPDLLSDLGGGLVDAGLELPVPPSNRASGCATVNTSSPMSWLLVLLGAVAIWGRRRRTSSLAALRRPFLAALVVGCAMPLTTIAHAQGMVERQQARVEFERGVARYSAGAYTSALEAFQSAYRIAPHPSVRVNIANCYERLDRPVEALFHFRRFLQEAADAPPEQRAEVEEAIERLGRNVGEVSLHILPDGAEVRIDGSDVRRAPILDPVPLRAGDHTVEVSSPGHETARRPFEVPAQGMARVSIALQPAQGGGESMVDAVEPPSPPSVDDRVDDRSFFERIGVRTYVAAGVTVALLTAAIVVGSLSVSARNDFDASTARSENPTLSLAARQRAYDQSIDDADRANALALAADGLGVASLVGAGVTVALIVIGLNSDSEDEPVSDGLVAMPTLDRDGGGFRLVSRF